MKWVKHPSKVMVWGCFSWKGRGGLAFLKPGEMMRGARYRQVLEDKLDFFMNWHGTTHFFSGWGTCHRSNVVKDWFPGKPNVGLIKWPGNSPDLNPIENVWAWMKTQLKSTFPTNLEQLK